MVVRIRTLFVVLGAALLAAAGCGDSDSGLEVPELCSLPFETGPCEALIPVYAFVGGSCEPRIYGGCEGNENRFYSLEECLATCDGHPHPYGCPPDRVRASICVACGEAGGCDEELDACATPCSDDSQCTGLGFSCAGGLCQAAYCE